MWLDLQRDILEEFAGHAAAYDDEDLAGRVVPERPDAREPSTIGALWLARPAQRAALERRAARLLTARVADAEQRTRERVERALAYQRAYWRGKKRTRPPGYAEGRRAYMQRYLAAKRAA